MRALLYSPKVIFYVRHQDPDSIKVGSHHRRQNDQRWWGECIIEGVKDSEFTGWNNQDQQ